MSKVLDDIEFSITEVDENMLKRTQSKIVEDRYVVPEFKFTNERYKFNFKKTPEMCADCEFYTYEQDEYQRHRQTHKTFLCNECGEEFKMKKTLKMHMLKKHLKAKNH